jgi:hypothetical protein
MADNRTKAKVIKTYIHWVLWSDRDEQEWIKIGRTDFLANGHGETKFTCSPTNAWGWRCVTLPLGEAPPDLPPEPPPERPATPPRRDTFAQETGDTEAD